MDWLFLYVRQVFVIQKGIAIKIKRHYIKKLSGIFLYFIFLNFLFAQEALEIDSWRLLESPLEDEQIQTVLSNAIENGYLPAGMDIVNSSIIFLMEKESMGEGGAFYLQYISDLGDVNQTFAAFAQKGFAPADIAFTDEGLLVLFIKTSATITGFRIVPVEGQAVIVRQRKHADTVKKMAEEGKIPFGLSRQNETLMTGYVTPYRNWIEGLQGEHHIDSFENNGIDFPAGVTKRLKNGFHIVGCDFTGDKIIVGFIR